ncbi:MAG: hypothetical protein ACWGSQ_16790, partial [Longimicrobiales bacterium]
MRQELEAVGAHATDGAGEAELCVVNTCTVTNQADEVVRTSLNEPSERPAGGLQARDQPFAAGREILRFHAW